MSTKYSVKHDLDELERMTERLVDYVLGDTLYLSIGGGFTRSGATPQLTIGNALLRRRRLQALRALLDAAQAARLDAVLAQHDAIQREWRLHYEKKLRRELPARLKLLRGFLYDCRENPRNCAAVYPVEALRRTVVQEILLALDEFAYDKGDAAAQVAPTDMALRQVLVASDFIWSDVLEDVYPRASFWWLYAGPPAA